MYLVCVYHKVNLFKRRLRLLIKMEQAVDRSLKNYEMVCHL